MTLLKTTKIMKQGSPKQKGLYQQRAISVHECVCARAFLCCIIFVALNKSLSPKYWFVSVSFTFLCAHSLLLLSFLLLILVSFCGFCKTAPYISDYMYSSTTLTDLN